MAIAVRSMWDPFGSLRQFDSEFDTLVRRAFAGSGSGNGSDNGNGGSRAAFVPAADVVRDGGDVVVTLELPGIDVEKDVEVEVADRRLLVSGRRHEESSEDKDGVLVRETRTGTFRREFALPEHVTAEQVEADYDRGLLKIRVRDIAKPAVQPRRITVRTERPAVEPAGEPAVEQTAE
jgi:HSP20 family protein